MVVAARCIVHTRLLDFIFVQGCNIKMVWDASPEIFTLGPLTFRWYGLLFALGFVIGYQLLKKIYINESVPLDYLEKLVPYFFIGAVVGARLGHCLLYEPQDYLKDPLRILKIWEGGLASHGGTFGIFIATIFYIKKYPRFSILWMGDRYTVPVGLASCLIRIGNFFNSEIIGKPTTSPFGVIFTSVDQTPRHPAQLYESFMYALAFVMAMYLYKIKKYEKPGFMLGSFLLFVFGSRFLIEFVKEPQVDFERSLPLDMGQLLSIPVILIALYLIFTSGKRAVVPATTGKSKKKR